MSEWISVEDRLPDVGVWIVAMRITKRPYACRLTKVRSGQLSGTAFIDADGLNRDPTHWVELPEPPK